MPDIICIPAYKKQTKIIITLSIYCFSLFNCSNNFVCMHQNDKKIILTQNNIKKSILSKLTESYTMDCIIGRTKEYNSKSIFYSVPIFFVNEDYKKDKNLFENKYYIYNEIFTNLRRLLTNRLTIDYNGKYKEIFSIIGMYIDIDYWYLEYLGKKYGLTNISKKIDPYLETMIPYQKVRNIYFYSIYNDF